MPTATDYTQTAQEQTLKTVKQGQQVIVEAIRAWANAVEKAIPETPAIPYSDELPEAAGDHQDELRIRGAAAEGAEGVRRERARRRLPGARQAVHDDEGVGPADRSVAATGRGVRPVHPHAAQAREALAPRACRADRDLERLPEPARARTARAVGAGAQVARGRVQPLGGDAARAGRPPGRRRRPRAADTEAAIRADPRLTEAQKEAMLGVYRSFTTEPEN